VFDHLYWCLTTCIGVRTPVLVFDHLTQWQLQLSVTCIILHCVSKNEPTSASCTFDKHLLVSIILGSQHQHSLKNICIFNFPGLFTSAYFICGGNDATPAPHWHIEKHITKCHWQSCWSMEKAAMCMHEGETALLWTSAEIKLALFRGTGSFQIHQQSTKGAVVQLAEYRTRNQ